MSSPPSLSDFRPVVGGDASAPKKKFRVSRSVVIFVVVGIHLVAGTLFVLPRVIKAVEEARAEPEGPPLALVDMEITAAESQVAAKPRKPRVRKPEVGETPEQLARRAGVAVDSPARTLLLVIIGQDGKPGAVTVAESSGNPRIDEIALQYTRAQEWAPVGEGEESAGSVPFVVEFAAEGVDVSETARSTGG